jgi:hypothetical protein
MGTTTAATQPAMIVTDAGAQEPND